MTICGKMQKFEYEIGHLLYLSPRNFHGGAEDSDRESERHRIGIIIYFLSSNWII